MSRVLSTLRAAALSSGLAACAAGPVERASIPSAGVAPTAAPAAIQDEGEIESEILEVRRGGQLDGLEPEEPTPTRARLTWDQGPRFDSAEGRFTAVFGGRLHLDAAKVDLDREAEQAFGEPDNGIVVRRAFIETGAVYDKQLEFRLMLNVAEEGEVDFRDVFVGYFPETRLGGVRAGYFKEPFGLEEITSSNDITFMERSLTDTFIERRNLGAMAYGWIDRERRTNLSLGFFRDADNDLDMGDGGGVTGRLTGLPRYEREGRDLIHLGASATLRRPSDDTLRFSTRPESSQAPVMADTGSFSADLDGRLGLEFAAVADEFSLQSELILATASTDGSDPLFTAGYVAASYVLSGEHRRYRRNAAAFGRVHPEDGLTAWELAGRYSFVDLDSGDIQGGWLEDYTLGLNLYFTSYTRLMFNYVVALPDDFGPQHIFQMRLQLVL